MAYDEQTAARVRRILSPRTGVVERKMMGALAFMVNGSMCCSVGRDWLLVRVGAEDREATLSMPHVEPMTLGAKTMSGFVRVAPEGYVTEGALARWIGQGIKAACGS